MNGLVIENIYHRNSKNTKEYLEVIFLINELYYEYRGGMLSLVTHLLDLEGYSRVSELDAYKKKYGELKISELRYAERNSNSFVLINDGLLFCSVFTPDTYSVNSLHEIYFIDDILSEENKAEYEIFQDSEIIELPVIG